MVSNFKSSRTQREALTVQMEKVAEEPVYVSVPKSFAKDAVWLLNKCTKPNKKEYIQIVWAVTTGFLVMGFTGYLVKLVHIPINNIIVGGSCFISMATLNSIFHGVREYLNPVLKNSKFKETGVLTPEEFVAAGDYLVFKCPTWTWEAGVKGKQKDFLPPDKQFLITKNIPCLKRVKQIEAGAETEVNDGDWVSTYANHVPLKPNEITEILESSQLDDIPSIDNIQEIDDIPDIDDYCEIDSDGELNSNNGFGSTFSNNILKTRTYDISITYDKYYQTPRVWLCGYDEDSNLLKPSLIFEDISQDHAKKTVTIEPHPHLNIQIASIHPCNHANVMKKIIERSTAANRSIRVDLYLIIFLKFISTVLPTIEYDYTMSSDF
ncbi:hypothetical protein BB561_003561 [Smittium simulii]|uniref:Autophagy-related protein 3 n=1 Tax=Smittium simulii TaxID=133385 RepID=A0A2T9YKP1_9FUNG|nr:hypothetical protein BB561_003561 [Smittium simulii]